MTNSALAFLLLPLFFSPLAAQNARAAESASSPEFELLLETESFDREGEGLLLRILLARPRTEARALLLELIKRASPVGQLHALCGLYVLDRAAFDLAVKPFLLDEREVSWSSGCIVSSVKVREIVRSRSRWAIRLPPDYAGTSWEAWERAQGWPAGVQGRADICGGAYPLQLTGHAGFLEPDDPVGTIQVWIARLGAKEVEVEEVGKALSRFGRKGLEAARILAKHKNPKMREAAALAVSELGVGSLGPESDSGAAIVGALLSDRDPQVAKCAARALSELAPWINSARPLILKALKQLALQPAGCDEERAKLLLRLGSYLGEEALPSLVKLLRVPKFRCQVLCLLPSLGTAARPALAKEIADPSLDCARDGLSQLGVLPASPEFDQIADLLRGDDEELVSWAAETLGWLLGQRAGPSVAAAIALAQERHEDSPGLAATLALARWRVSGHTQGLVRRLVASKDYFALPEVLKGSPELLLELSPYLRKPGKRRCALLQVLAKLGPKAGSLGADLRGLASTTQPGHPEASDLALAVFKVTGHAEFSQRVAAQLMPTHPRRALSLLRGLGPKGLPLLDEVARRLRDQDEVVRRIATNALGAFGPGAEARTVPLLVSALDDKQAGTSALVNLVDLAEAKSQLAREALEDFAASNQDSYRRFLAQEAVDELRFVH